MYARRMTRWGATTFSVTTELLRRDDEPEALAEALLRGTGAETIEVDGFQQFRGFPDVGPAEAAAFRAMAERARAEPTVLGGYLDPRSRRSGERDPEECAGYLRRQLRSARAAGFTALRVPMGVPVAVLELLRAELETGGVALLQEIQGAMRPENGVVPQQAEAIERLDSPALGFVFDSSVAMPGLPPSYRRELGRIGLRSDEVDLVEAAWLARDRAAVEPVADGHRGEHLARILMPFSRFGATRVEDWHDYAPLVRAVHLKFWDVEQGGGQLRTATVDTLALFPGLDACSEWGGHEWSEASGVAATRDHLALVRSWKQSSARSRDGEGT
jgi:hypothetical protein